MAATINLTCVSPSGAGDYMVCPWKLVADTDYPEGDEERYVEHKNFGTVAHYHAQLSIGADPVPDIYTEAEFESARSLKGMPRTLEGFRNRVQKCADKANSVIREITPLAAGQMWISEHRAYDPNILSGRVGRKGDVCGYGGKVDLLRNDRQVLWDYKFTGQLPTARGETIKQVYLMQLASYHINTGAPLTGIVWVTRAGSQACYLLLDWTEPKLAALAEHFRRFLRFVESPHFRKYAWPVRGDACTFCDHPSRCPCHGIPEITDMSISLGLSPTLDPAMEDLFQFAENTPKTGDGLLGGPSPTPPPPPPPETPKPVGAWKPPPPAPPPPPMDWSL